MKTYITALLFSGLCALSLAAQSTHQVSPFAQAFADFHSPDPAVVAKAKTAGSLALLFEAELPVIEQDSAVFCSGLKDPDPYIRLQASAIYSGMLDFAPQHAGMILACKDGMLKAALDEDDQTRVNVLTCLALNPRGTPTEAHDVFVKALSYPDARTQMYGAVGLLREGKGDLPANEQIVEHELVTAPDALHRLNMLYAISGSKVVSPNLYTAIQPYINDPDADVQKATVDAIVTTATDHTQSVTALQNIVASPQVQQGTREEALGALNRIGSAHAN